MGPTHTRTVVLRKVLSTSTLHTAKASPSVPDSRIEIDGCAWCRVGRTARGRQGKGRALLFLLPEELGFLRFLKVHFNWLFVIAAPPPPPSLFLGRHASHLIRCTSLPGDTKHSSVSLQRA